jgi:hypothetical protein
MSVGQLAEAPAASLDDDDDPLGDAIDTEMGRRVERTAQTERDRVGLRDRIKVEFGKRVQDVYDLYMQTDLVGLGTQVAGLLPSGTDDPPGQPPDASLVAAYTGPTVDVNRLNPGDRVWLAGRPVTVAATENVTRGVSLDVVAADRRTVTVRLDEDVVLDRYDPATLPDPDDDPRGQLTARPALYTYQRKNIVALGLDYDTTRSWPRRPAWSGCGGR